MRTTLRDEKQSVGQHQPLAYVVSCRFDTGSDSSVVHHDEALSTTRGRALRQAPTTFDPNSPDSFTGGSMPTREHCYAATRPSCLKGTNLYIRNVKPHVPQQCYHNVIKSENMHASRDCSVGCDCRWELVVVHASTIPACNVGKNEA